MKYYINYSNYYPDADEVDADVNTTEIDAVSTTMEEALDYQFEQIMCIHDADSGDFLTVEEFIRSKLKLAWINGEIVTTCRGLKWTFYIKPIEAV